MDAISTSSTSAHMEVSERVKRWRVNDGLHRLAKEDSGTVHNNTPKVAPAACDRTRVRCAPHC